MNEETPTVDALLKDAQAVLRQNLAHQDSQNCSSALEIHILFEYVSGKNRAWQIAHGDDAVSPELAEQFHSVISKRLTGMPIAYIVGTQAFWSLNLEVSPCTLIPRQDTETLIEVALELALPPYAKVLDLGTGSGAIALALKKERPDWQVCGVDFVEQAVALAQRNAQLNALDVQFRQSDWFSALQGSQFDLIVSNPPYVEDESTYLDQGDLRFEPITALTSGSDGLDDIRKIVPQALSHLSVRGFLLIEHGFEQGLKVSELMAQHGYENVRTFKDPNQHDRVSQAQKVS